jgi:hypothetical protein
MLTDKVFVDIQNHEAAERRVEHDLATKSRVKIFCLVYTTLNYTIEPTLIDCRGLSFLHRSKFLMSQSWDGAFENLK